VNEDKSSRYHRLKRRGQVVSLALVATALVSFTAAGGGVLLERASSQGANVVGLLGGWHRTASIVLAAMLLAFGVELVALPGAYYTGFVLDRRFGLSRQSRGEWWRDYLKASALALVIAALLAAMVYAAIATAPRAWWLAAGVGLALFAALVAAGAPVVLLPLFYRFDRVAEGELASRLTALAARAGTPVLGVYRWFLGDRSRTANAALVGLGPTRRILLSDTLLSEYTPDEIEVIIAHELAHHVHGDIWKGVALEGVQGTLALLAAHVALVTLGWRIGADVPADLAGMPLLGLVAAGWSVLTAPLLLAQSRVHERRADRFALELTDKADAFISAMRRLGQQNLADEAPSPLVRWLFHSHPPLSERISAARQWAANQVAG
jgi:STE24 endopeptidase